MLLATLTAFGLSQLIISTSKAFKYKVKYYTDIVLSMNVISLGTVTRFVRNNLYLHQLVEEKQNVISRENAYIIKVNS